MKALICEKWEMEFSPPPPESGKVGVLEKPYLSHLFEKGGLRDISANAAAGYWLLHNLSRGTKVVEFFGGIGLHTTILQRMCFPERHLVIERDPHCLGHLNRNFGNAVEIVKDNAWEVLKSPPSGFDIYLLDWNSWTAKRLLNTRPIWHKILTDNHPEAVLLFDSARSYFYLHSQAYNDVLGRPIDRFEEYTRGLSTWFLDYHGYSIAKAAYCPRGTYYLLKSGKVKLRERSISSKEKGFVWLPESKPQP